MRAGLKAGDVITAYDSRPVARSEELPRAVANTPVGRDVPLTLVRQGQTLTLTVTIGRLEEPMQEATATPRAKSRLGLSLQSLTPTLARELGLGESRGVLVRDVEGAISAASAGLQPGDVIVEVDHHAVETASQVRQLAATHLPGTRSCCSFIGTAAASTWPSPAEAGDLMPLYAHVSVAKRDGRLVEISITVVRPGHTAKPLQASSGPTGSATGGDPDVG